MNLPMSEKLPIGRLARIFENMSQSYKIFWFQAIVSKIREEINNGNEKEVYFSYDELINCMIADAWYMVSEYRLNLGPSDTLESVVHYAFYISNLKSSEKRDKILAFLESCNDSEFLKKKRTLSYNVPYRLQATLIPDFKGNQWNRIENVINRINGDKKRLFYYYDELLGLQKNIIINEIWKEYIVENGDIIDGWIKYKLIEYLQRRNPSVPGIPNKLKPPLDRKLQKVKKYWLSVMEVTPLINIYTESIMDSGDISIDHFIPWSYVAHDELWNLLPTTKSINSRKSNNLPLWDKYFIKLCNMEYMAFSISCQYDLIAKQFETCKREHINNNELLGKLYRAGISQDEFTLSLEKIMLPVYNSAKNMGFESWELKNKQQMRI